MKQHSGIEKNRCFTEHAAQHAVQKKVPPFPKKYLLFGSPPAADEMPMAVTEGTGAAVTAGTVTVKHEESLTHSGGVAVTSRGRLVAVGGTSAADGLSEGTKGGGGGGRTSTGSKCWSTLVKVVGPLLFDTS